MKCGDRALRTLPVRSAFRLQGRPGFPWTACGSLLPSGRSNMHDDNETQNGGLEVRRLRRLPVESAGLRRRTARPWPERSTIANFPEASRAIMKGPYDIVAGRRLDHHAPRRRAHPQHPPACPSTLITIGACATAGGIQALRNLQGRATNSSTYVYASPEYIETLKVDADRRSRARGFRIARLPDQQIRSSSKC